MKKLILTAVLSTALLTLSSFTTISVNDPKDSTPKDSAETNRSVFHCMFATIGVSIGTWEIIAPAYSTWEACRAA